MAQRTVTQPGNDSTMPRILLVEDSRFFGSLVKKEIEVALGFEVVWAQTYGDAENQLNQYQGDFFVALLDLNLPDASMGKIVDLVVPQGIPTIVFTGEISDEVRDHIWSKRVADYVLKQGKQDVAYVLSVIRRLHRNTKTKILVVDDSSVSRMQILKLLKIHCFELLEAGDGKAALAILDENPDIRLVITDYFMPAMDGFELTKTIRQTRPREELAIIGISAQGNPLLSAKFIKNGANDFITKPFISEEFYCRVTQNIEIIEHIETIRNMSHIDFLTGLFNRRYFYQTGGKLFANAMRGQFPMALGMFDIDDFKRVNDKYGHEAGDQVLKQISQVLKECFRESDIVARFGGEEFCVLIANVPKDMAGIPFEKARARIEAMPIMLGKKEIQVTVSVGVCDRMLYSLDEMAAEADRLLYKAKNGGKNQVVCH